ncbi:MAG: hypothetical protein Q4C70_13530 [Planctomycetia bacterium]|nr:hypothetical protein [Planctomycetia bacterium]
MKKLKCAHCGWVAEVENPINGMNCPNCAAELIGNNAQITGVCVFCEKDIYPHEVGIFCPACGKEYHHDCWIDNDGCGTEGCEYQDCLAPIEIPLSASAPAASISSPVSTPILETETETETETESKTETGSGIESEMTSKSASDDEYFVIQDVPKAQTASAQDEETLLEERMAVIRKREEMPEEKKITWQDMMDWKNTPRDTKYDFDGPWYRDPYLFQKGKNYAIFTFGGLMGGAVLGVSLLVLMAMFKYMFFHTGLSFYTMVFWIFFGIVAGVVAAIYFAYRTMATLIDN